MTAESQPRFEQYSSEENLDAMYERTMNALTGAVVEKIKNSPQEDAKMVLDDLLVFDRVLTSVLHDAESEVIDFSAYQEMIDTITQKYGLGSFSVEKYRELARKG